MPLILLEVFIRQIQEMMQPGYFPELIESIINYDYASFISELINDFGEMLVYISEYHEIIS